MAKELLTARGLEAQLKAAQARAAESNTRVRISDGDNLNLVVRANGGASWVLTFRAAGQRKPLTLGNWPAVSLKTARELASKAREQIALGVDPLEKKKVERKAAAVRRSSAGDTVRKLFTDWLAKHPGSEVYKGNIEAAFMKDVLPAIGTKAPHEVTRRDIIDILRAIEKRKALVMLRRVRMWLSQMFDFAIDDEERPIEASPVPSGHLRSFMAPTHGHFAAVTNAGDVAPLMRQIRGYDKPVVRTALELSAYLWQRPTELREATWSEFDLDAGKWVIPAERMKLRREHWVPLAPQVVQLLRKHQGVVGDEGWLFPGQRYEKPISEGTLGGALESLGYKDLHTPHGFRAMASTVLAEHLHVDERFIEKQLSHEEEDKVKRAYNRAEFWAQRVTMMTTWADWLDSQR